jgi:GntR family transcriptional regulator, galactonate operon transcriptional repressor
MASDALPATLKPRVHAGVVRSLGQRILSGHFPPGAVLPNEGRLCAELEVSRTALREAIRTLSAKGLVETKPRTGTRVRAREEWNRLDPDLLDWARDQPPDHAFIHSLLEARRIIEPSAAEFAAQRATGRDLAALEEAFEGMRASLPHDVETCCRYDLDFHAALLRASHNIVLQQLSGAVGAALMAVFRLSMHLSRSHQRALEAHREVLERIRLRDPAGARAAVNALLGVAESDLAPIEPTGRKT